MYRITYGNWPMMGENKDAILQAPTLTQEANTASTFEFDINPLHYLYEEVVEYGMEVSVYDGTEIIFCGPVREISVDIFQTKHCVCESKMSFLNDTVIGPHSYSRTMSSMMNVLLTEHNGQIEPSSTDYSKVINRGTVHGTNKTVQLSTYYNSTMEAFSKLQEEAGGYFIERYDAGGTLYLDWYESADLFPEATGGAISLGGNITDFNKTSETEVATRIIPLGAKVAKPSSGNEDERIDIKSVNDGLPYVETTDGDLLQKYGVVTKIMIFDDVTNKTVLMAKAMHDIDDMLNITEGITLTALDVYDVDPNHFARIRPFTRVRVNAHQFGLYGDLIPVMQRSIDLSSPYSNAITIGEVKDSSISSQIAEMEAKASSGFTLKNFTVTGTTTSYGNLKLSDDTGIVVVSAECEGRICLPFRFTDGKMYVKVLPNTTAPSYLANTEVTVKVFYY